MYAGSSDSRPPTGGGKIPPQAPEGGDASTRDPPISGQGEVSHPQGPKGAPEPPKLREEGDLITISDESAEGLPLSGDHIAAEGVEVPRVEGWTPWPTGFHTAEEERKKKTEEEQRKNEEEEKKMQE